MLFDVLTLCSYNLGGEYSKKIILQTKKHLKVSVQKYLVKFHTSQHTHYVWNNLNSPLYWIAIEQAEDSKNYPSFDWSVARKNPRNR